MKRLTLALILGLALPSFGRGGIDIDGEREWASADILLEEPVFGGTACNYPDAAALKLEDGKLKVKFADFGVRARSTRLDRATCMFSVAAQWPAGKQIVIKNAKIRGSYTVAAGKAVATAELFTTGGTGQTIQSQANSGSGNFREVAAGEVHRSDCSGSGLLRLNSSVRLTGSGAMTLDRLSAELSLEDCH